MEREKREMTEAKPSSSSSKACTLSSCPPMGVAVKACNNKFKKTQ